MAAAAHLMAERGYHGVSIGDLGAAAGVTGPAMYRHFVSKQAILGAMLADISERLLEEGQRRVGASGTALEALDELVRWHVQIALEEADLIRVQARDFTSMTLADQRQVRRLQRRYLELWVTQLLVLNPGLADELARARVHLAFGLLNSALNSTTRLTDADAVAMLHGLATLVLTAQLPPTRPSR
jgi:AcrR family transcriptional regulator